MRLFGLEITRANSQPVNGNGHAIANAPVQAGGNIDVRNHDAQSSDLVGMREIFGVTPSASGVYVSPDNAMRVSACYACARLIAGGIGMMPMKFYRSLSNGETEPDNSHPLRWLFNESADRAFTASAWKELMLLSMLLYGDGFTGILRNRNGMVRGLLPFLPWQVTPRYTTDGELFYSCIDKNGKAYGVDPSDMLHFPSFGFNGLRSMSVVQWAAREAIGIALAADQFSGSFYANGARPPYALKHPADLSKEQIEALRSNWDQRYGGYAQSHRPIILTNGVDVAELRVSAEDAQLLQARQFQVIDIARAFGVPPTMIGESEKVSSWGSGVEHMTLAFIVFTLGPHTTRIEQEINRKIFLTDRYIARFDTRALMRLDATARAKYYREAMGGSQGPGWMTPNEIRHDDDLPPLDDGDERFLFENAATPTVTTAGKEKGSDENESTSAVATR